MSFEEYESYFELSRIIHEEDALEVLRDIILQCLPKTYRGMAVNQYDKNKVYILRALKDNRDKIIEALKEI